MGLIIWLLCGFLNFLLLSKIMDIKEIKDDEDKRAFSICILLGTIGFAIMLFVYFIEGYFICGPIKRWLNSILRFINKDG